MLYFKRVKNNGELEFLPFYLGCTYLHCSVCDKMIPIFDLSEYLSELAAGDDMNFFYSKCEECLDEECEREEEYMENHREEYEEKVNITIK